MNNWLNLGLPVAVYGLAANPPHRGHWACVEALVEKGFKVAMVHSFAHAFGKNMAPFGTRVEWLRQAAVDFKVSSSCLIWPIEEEVSLMKKAGDRVYSIEILDCARSRFGGVVKLAVGPDNAEESIFSRFHSSERIRSEYGLIVVPEVEGVRSTVIRERIISNRFEQDELSNWIGTSIAEEVSLHFNQRCGAMPPPELRSFKTP